MIGCVYRMLSACTSAGPQMEFRAAILLCLVNILTKIVSGLKYVQSSDRSID